MRIGPLEALAVIGGSVLLVGWLWDTRKPSGEARAQARRPLGTLQQEVYTRLVQAFPDRIVLAQVALSALITVPRKDRPRYGNKVIDFAVLGRDFEVQVLFELDDGTQVSHHVVGETPKELLEFAGYRVYTIDKAPDVVAVRKLVDAMRPA